MKRFLPLLLLTAFAFTRAGAQAPAYTAADTADLKLTTCDFDKGASAMVIFDKAEMAYKFGPISMTRHKRIKIFNEKGADAANIRLEYYGVHKDESLSILNAKTLNWTSKGIETTDIDVKQVYEERIDKNAMAKVFTFPNVHAGSVIDFTYKFNTTYSNSYPDWAFQTDIPTQYSEVIVNFNSDYPQNYNKRFFRKLAVDTIYKTGRNSTRGIWAMKNIPAFKEEAYMTEPDENIEGVYFRPMQRSATWQYVGNELLDDEDYGEQLDRPLDGEEEIIKQAKQLKTDQEQMAFIFNTVRNAMTWNKKDRWYTEDGTRKAWSKKTGNSAEINLILYHLLKLDGLNPKLITYSTRHHGKLDPNYPEFYHLNKTAVRIPYSIDKTYILDASDKYNVYDQVPLSIIGQNILTIDRENKAIGFMPVANDAGAQLSKHVVLLSADINANGTLKGKAQIMNTNYAKANALIDYNKLGEKKYVDDLREKSNDLKISDYKIHDMNSDSLPLREEFSFTAELTGADNDYIYVSPNLFTGLGVNPFISEKRLSDIDFIYGANFSIKSSYKVPAGFKIDALPKSMQYVTEDKGIVFKRTIGEMEGTVIVNYAIDIKKTYYYRDEYPELRQFFKTMYEMLNEQIVLKKG